MLEQDFLKKFHYRDFLEKKDGSDRDEFPQNEG
jgi:hypothetical protein